MEEKEKCYPNFDSNIWLRSCKREILEPMSGKVSGTIPSWINGVLIRNGPGLLEVGNCSFEHVFDGSAMLHRFAVKDGKITYQCRFVDTETYKKHIQANRIVFTEFGTKAVPDPCHTIFQRIATTFTQKQSPADNTNVAVFPFGDELYAFSESPTIYRINPTTLATEEKVPVNKNVVIVQHSVHPHVVKDGTVYNLAMSATKSRPRYNIVCFPPKPEKSGEDYSMFQQAHIVASIPARWPLYPSYIHMFGITENFFIIIEQPLSLSLPKMLIKRVVMDQPIMDCFKWRSGKTVQFNVVSRKTGKLAFKFFSEAFSYFHIINQYESSNHIVIDICSYKNASGFQFMYTETLKNIQKFPDYADNLRVRPMRFVLPLLDPASLATVGKNCNSLPNTTAEAYLTKNGKIFVKPERLCDFGSEMPAINYEAYSGREYQFYYSITTDIDAENPGKLIKVDVRNKTVLTWHEKNCYLSEPTFIQKPNSQSEDDGVVVASMLWGGDETNRTGLLVLDAKTFQELGRTEFETSGPVPKCFHGWFLPN